MHAKFDSDAAQHQQQQNYVERQIETAEAGGIEQWKGEIERSSARNQPHFIAVPHRTDGANHGHPFFFGPRNQQVQHSRAQIEAVKHDISDDHDGNEHKPHWFHAQLLSRSDWRPRAHVAGRG